jgi:serine/threonine protein kinase
LDRLGYDRELAILQEVNHPFLMKYIEEFVYKVTNRLCIITEFIAGGDFERYIRGNSGFTEE